MRRIELLSRSPFVGIGKQKPPDATARIGVIRSQFQLDLARVQLLSATTGLDALAGSATSASSAAA